MPAPMPAPARRPPPVAPKPPAAYAPRPVPTTPPSSPAEALVDFAALLGIPPSGDITATVDALVAGRQSTVQRLVSIFLYQTSTAAGALTQDELPEWAGGLPTKLGSFVLKFNRDATQVRDREGRLGRGRRAVCAGVGAGSAATEQRAGSARAHSGRPPARQLAVVPPPTNSSLLAVAQVFTMGGQQVGIVGRGPVPNMIPVNQVLLPTADFDSIPLTSTSDAVAFLRATA